MKLKKIIFPFYGAEQHHFLAEKWWFRLIIVFYVIGVTVLLGSIWSNFSSSSWGWCYDNLYLYSLNDAEFTQHFNECREIWEESFAWVVFISLVFTAAIHYLTQFIFFKIVINFVVLGGKKE